MSTFETPPGEGFFGPASNPGGSQGAKSVGLVPNGAWPQGPIFFGRRKGRPLGVGKQAALAALSQFAPDRWRQGPEAPWPQNLWLEIGFGFGEHLVQHLAAHPDTFLIGVEVFENGVAHACRLVGELPKAHQDRCALVHCPVHPFLAHLPPASLFGLYVLFPDPWPKARHHKRRMITPQFLHLCRRLVKPGGQLHFASDHPGLVKDTYSVLAQHPEWMWQEGIADPYPAAWPSQWPQHWPQTRYGQKAYAQGGRAAYGVWVFAPGSGG